MHRQTHVTNVPTLHIKGNMPQPRLWPQADYYLGTDVSESVMCQSRSGSRGGALGTNFLIYFLLPCKKICDLNSCGKSIAGAFSGQL